MITILISFATSKVPVEISSTADPNKLKWRKGGLTPRQFVAERGTAFVHGSTAYFSFGHEIYYYTSESIWTRLPLCMYRYFGLAVINDKLTTIGGRSNASLNNNALLSLSPGDSSWQEVLPPMPTGRALPAVVATDAHLVVAGGTHTDIVEVLEMRALQWFTASNVPKSIHLPHIAICSGRIFLQQGDKFNSCTIQELTRPIFADSKGNSVWKNQADVLQFGASIVVFGEHVLAIGGRDDQYAETTNAAIHC